MKRRFVVLALGLLLVTPAFATGISDNFESYALGTFPSPPWSDVGDGQIQTLPSAFVVATTDAFGNPTQALALRDEVAPSRGIYAPVNISSAYSLTADVRVDRYSDHPDFPQSDWAMELGFVQLGGDFAGAISSGIYASSLTGDWRIFVVGQNTSFDIDLGQAADIGTWYTVHFDFDATTLTYHSVIIDTLTGNTLVDRFDNVAGLTDDDVKYDSIAFFGGEVSDNTTVADLAVVDNINITATPEPTTLLLLFSGLAGLFMLTRRRNRV
jgi:hypothetical protein